MKDPGGTATDPLVTCAEIGRLAGVTRAAVTNWRRRHDDFPAPAGGAANSPLFRLTEVRAWLAKQRKGADLSDEVKVWQSLRGAFGDNIVQGLAALARLFTDGIPPPDLAPRVAQQALDIARSTSSADLIDALVERFTASARRYGSDQVSSPRIVRAVRHFVGPIRKTASILDPACGIGTLLFSVGPASAIRRGQDVDPAIADFAQRRATLADHGSTEIRTGDSLRDDRWPDLRADIVVCDPPVASSDWGRADLLLDARWELGTPARAEGELAWLQHAYAHTAQGGRTVMVMPASVAYRRAGRRIRAELVRRGILTEVVALPPGTATAHALPVHLWILRRPEREGVPAVRMVDLTANAPDGPLDPEPDQVVEVPLIDLLDDTVDLTPGTHVRGIHRDYSAEYAVLRRTLQDQLRALDDLLPHLDPGKGPGTLENATVGIADLARAGLVQGIDGDPVSASDQLDTDYLRGFLHGPANRRRSTGASGAFRVDPRGSRIPQMSIGEQRRYGAAFRALREVEERTRQLAELGVQATALAREGLTNGALNPPSERD